MGYTGAAGSNDGNWKGGGNTGLTTSNTWKGNTAYGPAGGYASGYATRDANSLNSAGMAPTMGTYGNFNNQFGQPAYGGALSGMSVHAPNAMTAYNAAVQAMMAQDNAVQSSPLTRPAVGAPAPVPQMPPVPTAMPMQQPPTILTKSMIPALFGANVRTPQMGMPVSYNAMRAAISPDYSRNMTRLGSNYNNPQLGSAARGTLGNYAGAGNGWGYGGNREGGYGAGGASFGYNR